MFVAYMFRGNTKNKDETGLMIMMMNNLPREYIISTRLFRGFLSKRRYGVAVQSRRQFRMGFRPK